MLKLAQGSAACLAALSVGIVLAGAKGAVAQTAAAPAQQAPEPSIANPAEPAKSSGQTKPPEPEKDSEKEAGIKAGAYTGGSPAEMLHVPVSGLHPGTVPINPDIKSPVANDPEAVRRGMQYFTAFNCSGCHAANGGGGMGPSLSNAKFIYGSDPANIYLSILQGRPNGMPAWGGMLPDEAIWDIVAYVQSLSKDMTPSWGKTTSLNAFKLEQVPAEYMKTDTPWKYTEPFSFGQKPDKKVK